MTDPTLYDRFPYLSRAMPQTHPSRLSTIAWLFGMNPAPLAEARVLELGCGDGGNLIPMALGMPGARLVGLDLSASAIQRGRERIEALGLKNLSLRVQDLADEPGDVGEYDYVVCHGVFSWVPPEVSERILALIRQCLAPQGVAFVSYNTLPGGHLRNTVNDLMRFHTRDIEDPEIRMGQAMAILDFVAQGALEGSGAYRAVVREERERLHRVDSESSLANHLIHDRLQETVRTPYFHEFMDRCDAHGLDYLGEADFAEMQDQYLPERIRKVLIKVSAGRIRVREQMLDFLKGRKFRQTLLCRAGTPLDRRLDPGKMTEVFAATSIVPLDEAGEPLPVSPAPREGRGELIFGDPGDGSRLISDHPGVQGALVHLGRNWPMPIHFEEIMTAAGKMGGPTGEESRRAVSEALLSAYSGSLAEIYRETPQFAPAPGDRPIASPLARLQLQTGTRVSTLTHRTVDLKNSYAPALLPLMDGVRDRVALLAEGLTAVRQADLSADGRAASEKTDAEIAAEIEAELDRLARYGLLMPEPTP
ncbi:MAG: methyltransferase regulatory domain-containing protein [Desulfococcaceae bacterium]